MQSEWTLMCDVWRKDSAGSKQDLLKLVEKELRPGEFLPKLRDLDDVEKLKWICRCHKVKGTEALHHGFSKELPIVYKEGLVDLIEDHFQCLKSSSLPPVMGAPGKPTVEVLPKKGSSEYAEVRVEWDAAAKEKGCSIDIKKIK